MGLTPMQPKRCAIYARVSPKPEGAVGDNFSIASQLDAMRELALKDFGCDSPDEYIDRNRSGATLDRPELDRLRDNLALKLYDVVIAYSPDRWTRGDEMDNVILDQELKKAGARMAYCSGNYEDSPEGELARDVQNSVSRYERKKFRERTRRCRRRKSREGHPHACCAPDGYRYEGHKHGKKGEYVIVPERAAIIRQIFQMAAKGVTNSAIAAYLNGQGIKTMRAGRMIAGTPASGRWHPASVSQLLAKTAYYGEMLQNGVLIEVPAIVSRALWEKVHEIAVRNKIAFVGRRSKSKYLLTSLLWCGRCGKRMRSYPHGASRRDKPRSSYRCSNCDYAKGLYVRGCSAPGVAQNLLEPVIWDAVWDTVCDRGLLWQLIEAYHERVIGRPAKKDPAIIRLDRARRKVARCEEILGDPDAPISYAQAKAQLDAARRELAEAKIAGGAVVTELPLRKDVNAVSAALSSMRHELVEFEDRRQAILLLVEKIVYADGAAEIHCQLPMAVPESGNNCKDRECDASNLNHAIPFVINAKVSTGRWRAA